ncbi:hypothetical protein AgCh_001880 [Apium graveolens]
MDIVSQLQRQYVDFMSSIYREGLLNDQFLMLQKFQDERDPQFVNEVVSHFFENSERHLRNLTVALDQQPVDYTKVNTYVHQCTCMFYTTTMAHVPMEVQIQDNQHGPSQVENTFSVPIEARKPTTSSSQKGESQTPESNPQVFPTSSGMVQETVLTTQTTSSDMVQKTVLTTQTPHLDGERLLVGIEFDDTITNMGDLSVFTEDPMIVTYALLCANQPSQAIRFEVTFEGELSKSTPIYLEVPVTGTTPLTTLTEITLTLEARSIIANDPAMGEARTSHLCDSALQEAKGFEAGAHDSNEGFLAHKRSENVNLI